MDRSSLTRSKIILLLVLVTILLLALSAWFWQRNIYSKEILKIDILAPKEVKAGEETEYSVTYKNNGTVRLEQVRLIFEFPSGSIPSEGTPVLSTGSGDISRRFIQRLEDVYPGQQKTFTFKGRLFGKEGELKEARALLSYRPKNLSASYQSETTANTAISEVPLSLDLDVPSKVTNLDSFNFSLNYSSHSAYPFSGLRITMEYPQGFELAKTIPPSVGEGEWNVGTLNKSEGGKITVQGALQGGIGSSFVFHATIGSWKEGTYILLKEVTKAVEIESPAILVNQTVNASSSPIASAGETLHYEVSFRNISDENLENLFLVIRLEGKPYDLYSIRSNQGRFAPGDNTIVWDGNDLPALRFLTPGEEGRVDFWVGVKNSWDRNAREKNFVLRSTAIVQGTKNRLDTKVNSKFAADQKAFFKEATFQNSGPLPPRAGEPTSYTVIWELKNSYNDMDNVKVRAQLGEGVRLIQQNIPPASEMKLNEETRELEWSVPYLPAGTASLKAVFQIQFIPAESQRGSVAQLVGSVMAIGRDTFTGSTLEATDNALDTSLPDDPAHSSFFGIIQ